MKTRQGFVSNSSTSSFCIYGTALRLDNDISIIETLQKIKKEDKTFYEKCIKNYHGDEDIKDELLNIDQLTSKQTEKLEKVDLQRDNYDVIETLAEIFEFELFSPGYDNECYFGKSWSKIKDDETGKQFKDYVNQMVKSLFNKNDCETIEEAWHD